MAPVRWHDGRAVRVEAHERPPRRSQGRVAGQWREAGQGGAPCLSSRSGGGAGQSQMDITGCTNLKCFGNAIVNMSEDSLSCRTLLQPFPYAF